MHTDPALIVYVRCLRDLLLGDRRLETSGIFRVTVRFGFRLIKSTQSPGCLRRFQRIPLARHFIAPVCFSTKKTQQASLNLVTSTLPSNKGRTSIVCVPTQQLGPLSRAKGACLDPLDPLGPYLPVTSGRALLPIAGNGCYGCSIHRLTDSH
jgi:hypothetical protein